MEIIKMLGGTERFKLTFSNEASHRLFGKCSYVYFTYRNNSIQFVPVRPISSKQTSGEPIIYENGKATVILLTPSEVDNHLLKQTKFGYELQSDYFYSLTNNVSDNCDIEVSRVSLFDIDQVLKFCFDFNTPASKLLFPDVITEHQNGNICPGQISITNTNGHSTISLAPSDELSFTSKVWAKSSGTSMASFTPTEIARMGIDGGFRYKLMKVSTGNYKLIKISEITYKTASKPRYDCPIVSVSIVKKELA